MIRLQALDPRSLSPPLLAPPRPQLLLRRGVRGSLPNAPADVSTGAPLQRSLWISAVFLSPWPRRPRYRTYSSPPCSFHLSHLRAQRGYGEPYSEMRAMGQPKRWMIPQSLRSLCSGPLLTSTPLRALLPSSPAWSNSPGGAFRKTAVVIRSDGASSKKIKVLIWSPPSMMPVFAQKKDVKEYRLCLQAVCLLAPSGWL